MADTPKVPTPPRRKAATGTRKTTRATPPKATKAPVVESSEPAATAAVATPPVKKPVAPRKPPARKSIATKPANAPASVKPAVKSGTAKTARPATPSSTAKDGGQPSPAQLVADTRERMGDRNFFTALIGGVAALGAAVGGIFYALRDGNPDKPGGTKDSEA